MARSITGTAHYYLNVFLIGCIHYKIKVLNTRIQVYKKYKILKTFLKNSETVGESSFVRQAAWCIPERELESDKEAGIIIRHCSGTRE